jgi:hypothetical protein
MTLKVDKAGRIILAKPGPGIASSLARVLNSSWKSDPDALTLRPEPGLCR